LTEELSQLKELRIVELYDSKNVEENDYTDVSLLKQIVQLTLTESKIKNFPFHSDNLKSVILNQCSLQICANSSLPFLHFIKIQECQGKQ
jgi:hypothetical protein